MPPAALASLSGCAHRNAIVSEAAAAAAMACTHPAHSSAAPPLPACTTCSLTDQPPSYRTAKEYIHHASDWHTPVPSTTFGSARSCADACPTLLTPSLPGQLNTPFAPANAALPCASVDGTARAHSIKDACHSGWAPPDSASACSCDSCSSAAAHPYGFPSQDHACCCSGFAPDAEHGSAAAVGMAALLHEQRRHHHSRTNSQPASERYTASKALPVHASPCAATDFGSGDNPATACALQKQQQQASESEEVTVLHKACVQAGKGKEEVVGPDTPTPTSAPRGTWARTHAPPPSPPPHSTRLCLCRPLLGVRRYHPVTTAHRRATPS